MAKEPIWCEEVIGEFYCENEAKGKAKPPRCEEHIPKCPDTTANGFPCFAPVVRSRADGRCSLHGRKAEGKPNGNRNPKCKGLRYGKPCTQYAVKGYDHCKHHSSPDPAERARIGAVAEAKRSTTNDRLVALIAGELSVEELSDEELLRGWPIPSSGRREGRPPMNIPLAVHRRCTQELFKRADEKLKESLLEAIGVMQQIMNDDNPDSMVSATDRIKAATWIYERVRGKIPDVVQHVQEKPFETIFTKVEAGVRKVSSERTSGALALESFVDAEEVGEDE